MTFAFASSSGFNVESTQRLVLKKNVFAPKPKNEPGSTAGLVFFGVSFLFGIFTASPLSAAPGLIVALPVYLYLKGRERAHFRAYTAELNHRLPKKN